MSWNPFSSSPSPRRSYARSSAGSNYSSSSRHHSSTSRYKRSPRDGYLTHLYHKFRQLLRDLIAYARRHPYKVFFTVVMPLVSGGVLHKLARQFGVNLPEMGGAGARGGYAGSGHQGPGGYYGSEGYGAERGGGGGGPFGGFDVQSVAGGIGNLAQLAQVASKFL